MTRMNLTGRLTAAVAGIALLLSACGSNGGSGGAPGVTDDKIVLGHLTDLAGPYGHVGKQYADGARAYVDSINKSGGLCGRDLELLVRDHRYNAQEAVTAYREMSKQVLGMEAVLGTGPGAALLPSLQKDEMLTSFIAWDQSLIKNDFSFLPGATYDVMTVNLMDWAVGEFDVKRGEALGVLVFEGAFGDSILRGAKVVADAYGLRVVEVRTKPTDTDFNGPITTLKNGGAKAVVVATTASQLATAMSTAASRDYDAKFMAPMPGNFDASLLDGPAKAALEKNYYSGASMAAWADPGAGPARVRDAIQGGDEKPSFGLMLGYAQAELYGKIVAKACEGGKDITRAKLLETFRSMSSVDTEGLISEISFTRGQGKSQAVKSTVLRPDSSVAGGLKLVKEPFVSPLVEKHGL